MFVLSVWHCQNRIRSRKVRANNGVECCFHEFLCLIGILGCSSSCFDLLALSLQAVRTETMIDGLLCAVRLFSAGGRIGKNGSGLNGCFRCVSLIFSGSGDQIAISLCQNRDLISVNDPILVPCPHKFVCHDILWRQSR